MQMYLTNRTSTYFQFRLCQIYVISWLDQNLSNLLFKVFTVLAEMRDSGKLMELFHGINSHLVQGRHGRPPKTCQ